MARSKVVRAGRGRWTTLFIADLSNFVPCAKTSCHTDEQIACSIALIGNNMKNFSTVGRVLSVAASLACLGMPQAKAQQGRLASEIVSPARMAGVKAACQFRADAPDQHAVVRGDTLWGIAGMFLQYPWCWPEVWGLNRDQIANPHWIYPGQIVYFDRAAGRLRLGTPLAEHASDMRLAPQVRTEALGADAVPSINSAAIEPWLTQALIIEEEQLRDAPRIVAIQENRVYVGRGDTAYVRGNLHADTLFQVFRPGKPLTDPMSGNVVAYEAVHLGTAKLTRAGADVQTVVIVNAKEEIGVGDQLLAMPARPLVNYVPHRPWRQVEAAVMSIYGGVAYAGQNQIVTVNRGHDEGLDTGAVLNLYRRGEQIADKTVQTAWYRSAPMARLPDEQYGNLFIFRVFRHVSYGLVMQVRDAVQVGDGAQSPQ